MDYDKKYFLEEHNLPKDIPDEYYSSIIRVDPEQNNKDIGWKYEHVLNVINYLCDKGYAILGGDVYKIDNDGIEFKGDNWHIDKISKDSDKAYVEKSRKKAIDYVTIYHNRNSEKGIYVYCPIIGNKIFKGMKIS